MAQRAEPASGLSGTDLRSLFSAAAIWLDRNAAAVNAINVFPVPDGDTGTNMALTLRAAAESAQRSDDTVGAVLGALSRGALMGARGNSGVILSQYLRGFAGALSSAMTVSASALADALAASADAAYSAVERPQEGTILTVARAAGQAAPAARLGTCIDVLAAAVAGARDALQRTPDLLPVLREAGVVDAGGLGLCIALEGALLFLRGEPLPETAEVAGHIDRQWFDARRSAHEDGGEQFGYCVEFAVRGDALSVDGLRTALAPLGSSMLVVGDEQLAHVHVHTNDPGAALTAGSRRGRLAAVKVEDMDEQAARLAGSAQDSPGAGRFAVVAVAAGAGLAAALRGAGAGSIVEGGQTMNPSTQDLLDAIDATAGEHVVILPNNKNIIWTAEQAAKLSARPASVVPTRSMPQGIAALLALNPDDDPEAASTAMKTAANRIHTIEVTSAARTAQVNGVPVVEGQPIALLDDELVAAAGSPVDAAIAALRVLDPDPGPLITVYWGKDASKAQYDVLVAALREYSPEADVEALSGGQPFYTFVISVE